MDMDSSGAALSQMSHHGLTGPFIGNIAVLVIAGIVTVFVIVLALKMLIWPGERDPDHPKYSILRPDL